MSYESDGEEDENGDEDGDGEDSVSEKTDIKAKKADRKAKWSQSLLDDTIDIIISSDYFKKKLIFTNVKTQKNGQIYAEVLAELKKRCKSRNENVSFTVPQLRSKFKKLVAECKRVALTTKTSTGVKRFQDDKGYSNWFNQLFEVVKTRDSCRPELAVEPSASREEVTQSTEDEGNSEASQGCVGKQFVPVKSATTKKLKKEDPLVEAIHLMRSAIENDPTKQLIQFLKSDIEKSREHEVKLFQLLLTHSNPNPQTQYGLTSHHQGGYVSPSGINQGLSMPTSNFAPQSDYTLWEGNQRSFQPISVPPMAPSPSLSTDSSNPRGSPISLREGNASPFYHSM